MPRLYAAANALDRAAAEWRDCGALCRTGFWRHAAVLPVRDVGCTAVGGRVVLVVPKPLQRLMTTLKGVAAVLSEEDDFLPPFDYYCPLLSLPGVFGTTLESIPRAVCLSVSRSGTRWTAFLRGLPGTENRRGVGRQVTRTEQPHSVAIDKRRSMRLAEMVPLFSVPELQLRVAATRSASGTDQEACRGGRSA